MAGDNDADSAIVLQWSKEEEGGGAPRARNHTVMLTPELTQEVRARIQAQVDDARRLAPLPDPLATRHSEGVRAVEQSDWQKLEEVSGRLSGAMELGHLGGDVVGGLPGQQPIRPAGDVVGQSPLFDGNRPRGSVTARRDTVLLTELPPQVAGYSEEPAAPSREPQPLLNLGSSQSSVPEPVLSSPVPAVAAQQAPQLEKGSDIIDGVIHWARKTPAIGCLMTFDKDPDGEFVVLRSGRLVVSSEMSAPSGTTNMLVLKDPKVSLNHAVLRVSATGEIQILDQLSEFGTHIKRLGEAQAIVLSGDKCPLEHGDVVSFGDRNFHVCLLAASAK